VLVLAGGEPEAVLAAEELEVVSGEVDRDQIN